MSRSFTYKVDEKRLKGRLRSVTIPLNPDAWQWFDLHAGLEKPLPVKRLIPIDFSNPIRNIRIDRKVLMSAAVLAAILLLAFTLVSFLDFGKAKPGPSLQASTQ